MKVPRHEGDDGATRFVPQPHRWAIGRILKRSIDLTEVD